MCNIFSEFNASPLYPGAPISKEASWLSIYTYAASNRLTDIAIIGLLDLIKIHVPSSELCPSSIYKLKRGLGNPNDFKTLYFCSNCKNEVPKQCPSSVCKKKGAKTCYFCILPFENYLRDIFSGKVFNIYLFNLLFFCSFFAFQNTGTKFNTHLFVKKNPITSKIFKTVNHTCG